MNNCVRKYIWSFMMISVIAATAVIFHATQAFSKNFAKGQKQFEQNNYQLALVYFNSAAKEKHSDKRTIIYLANSYNALGKDEKVLQQLEKLEKFEQNDSETIIWMADLYYKLNDFEKAEKSYYKALSGNNNIKIELKLAEVMAWQGKYSQAAKIIKRMPQNRDNTEFLADIYVWNSEYSEAIALYKQLISQKYKPDIMLKLAETLRFARRDREAIVWYKKYLEYHNEL